MNICIYYKHIPSASTRGRGVGHSQPRQGVNMCIRDLSIYLSIYLCIHTYKHTYIHIYIFEYMYMAYIFSFCFYAGAESLVILSLVKVWTDLYTPYLYTYIYTLYVYIIT